MSRFNPRTLTQIADAFGGDFEKYRQPTKQELKENPGDWRVTSNHVRKVGPDGSANVPIYTRIEKEIKEIPVAQPSPPVPTLPADPQLLPSTTPSPELNQAVDRVEAYEDDLPNYGTNLFKERNDYYYEQDQTAEPYKSSDINSESERKASFFNNQYKLNIAGQLKPSNYRESASYAFD